MCFHCWDLKGSLASFSDGLSVVFRCLLSKMWYGGCRPRIQVLLVVADGRIEDASGGDYAQASLHGIKTRGIRI